MTPDQKMFVLDFIKQLHHCIENRGAFENGATSTNVDTELFSRPLKINKKYQQEDIRPTENHQNDTAVKGAKGL